MDYTYLNGKLIFIGERVKWARDK